MKFLAVLLCCTAGLLGSGCSNPELSSIQGFAQGTTYNISFWSPSGVMGGEGVTAGEVQAMATETLARIDEELSNYRDDSAIERFNAAQTTTAQKVPGSLVELVEIARQVRRASNGCYDLTIRPLFQLWGFGDEFRIPAADEIAATLAVVGMDKLTTVDDSHLAKVEPDLAIDVSSIAQGYTTARIADGLEGLGIEDYLVEVGGELLVQGKKPDGEPWRVAVERPLAGEREIQKIVEIQPGGPLSVVTSGTYRHYYDSAGRRYSHILDARTGAPVDHDLLSVTVIHPDPTLADAWSTALLCLGTDAGMKAATQQALAVLFIEADGEGLRERYSPAFENERWQLLDGPN